MTDVLYPDYLTDSGILISIGIGYQSKVDERLTLGGFKQAKLLSKYPMGRFIDRTQFRPRYVILEGIGKVYFYSWQLWANYLKTSDSQEIVKYQAESGSKRAIRYLLKIRSVDEGTNA